MFERLFLPAELRETLSDRAWLQAPLDVERLRPPRHGPSDSGGRSPRDRRGVSFRSVRRRSHRRRGPGSGNPVEPLVRALREAVGGDAAEHVHHGATSQDVLDSATMLVSRAALGVILDSTRSPKGAPGSLRRTARRR